MLIVKICRLQKTTKSNHLVVDADCDMCLWWLFSDYWLVSFFFYTFNCFRSLMTFTFPVCWTFCDILTEKLYYILYKYVFCLFFRMVRIVADEFLTDERDRKYYADHYTCCPPPLFIIIITLVEVNSQHFTDFFFFIFLLFFFVDSTWV